MLRPLQLLLPALLPSWGFFDYIQPSPRIQYQLLDAQLTPVSDWQPFRPRPQHLSPIGVLRRLLWNARWNETLFMMSCAERIVEHYTVHSENEITQRILRDFHSSDLQGTPTARHLHFRLVFVQRQQQQLVEEVRFTSRMTPMAEPGK